MIRFSYVYLSFHLVGGKQPSFPLLYCCVVLFVVEGSCAQSAFVSLLLPVRIALVFWEVILFSVPCPPPRTACPLARFVALDMLTVFCLLQRNPITKRLYEITLTCTVVSQRWLLETFTI